MALTEERIAYYKKLIVDYEEFLVRTHEPGFYTVQVKISDRNKFVLRTNEEHCKYLIQDAKEQLNNIDKS